MSEAPVVYDVYAGLYTGLRVVEQPFPERLTIDWQVAFAMARQLERGIDQLQYVAKHAALTLDELDAIAITLDKTQTAVDQLNAILDATL